MAPSGKLNIDRLAIVMVATGVTGTGAQGTYFGKDPVPMRQGEPGSFLFGLSDMVGPFTTIVINIEYSPFIGAGEYWEVLDSWTPLATPFNGNVVCAESGYFRINVTTFTGGTSFNVWCTVANGAAGTGSGGGSGPSGNVTLVGSTITLPVSVAADVEVVQDTAADLNATVVFPSPQHVIVDSGGGSPDVNLIEVGGSAIALGQTTMANSLPVTLASNQSALPVTGTFFQATQPISGAVTVSGTVAFSNTTIAVTNAGTFAVQAACTQTTSPWVTKDAADQTIGAAVSTTALMAGFKDNSGNVSFGTLDSTGALKVTGSGSGGVVSTTEEMVSRVSLPNNSSTTPLGAGASFTGAIFDNVRPYASVQVSIFTDQNGTLEIDYGAAGSVAESSDTYTVTANVGFSTAVNVSENFLRVKYTNGPIAQGQFILSTQGVPPLIGFPRSLTQLGNFKVAIEEGGFSGPVSVTQGTTPWLVDGSAHTQPISGAISFTAPQHTIVDSATLGTVTVSGSVTANIGTTGGLALDATLTGGTQKTLLYDGTNTIGTAAHPVQVSLANTGANATAVKVDGSAVTQPISGAISFTAPQHTIIDSATLGTVTVSGTVTTTPPSHASTNVDQWNGNTVDTNSGVKSAGTLRVLLATDQPQLTNALKVDGSAVTQPVSGTVTANAGSGTMLVDGSAHTQPVSGTFWQATQPVSGTVAVSNAFALDSSVNGILVAQVSTTSGQSGPLVQGAVTTSAPSYTTAKTSPLSLDTSGNLRVTGSFSSASVGVTGSAVPSSADFVGVNIGGNLRGVTGTNPTGTVYAMGVQILDNTGTAITTFGGGTQYANGTSAATPTGTVSLGYDGTNVRALKTDSTGKLYIYTDQNNPVITKGIWSSLENQNATWDSTTSINSFENFSDGEAGVVVQITTTSTITGGVITFEGSTDSNSTFTSIEGLDLVLGTVATTGVYTLLPNTTVRFVFNTAGLASFQYRLSTVITGTGHAVIHGTGYAAPNVALQQVNVVNAGSIGGGQQYVDATGGFSGGGFTGTVAMGFSPASGRLQGIHVDSAGVILADLTTLNGSAVDTNSGSKGPGTLRVVLATDQPQLTNALKVDGSAVTQPVSGAVSFTAPQHVIVDSATLGTVTTSDAADGSTGSAVPAKSIYVGGNKSGNLTGLALDGSGNLNVNVAAGTIAVTNAGTFQTQAQPALGIFARTTSAVISFSSSGDNTVVAGVTAQTIRVWKLFVVNSDASTATNITFKDSTPTSLSGAFRLVSGGSTVLDLDGEPWYVTASGKGFVINSSAAVQLSGTVYFTQS